MQGNYVKLLRPQTRDLEKRDGRSSISSTTAHRISHHVRSPEPLMVNVRQTGGSPALLLTSIRVHSQLERIVGAGLRSADDPENLFRMNYNIPQRDKQG
jgi:hypothetical protein